MLSAPTTPILRRRIRFLQRAVPLSLVVLVMAYQLGIARGVHNLYNEPVHFAIEIVFYGTVGPLLTYWTLKQIGVWLDERDQAERAALAKDRLLAAITTASADAIISLDPEGRIELWNRGAERLFYYEIEEILGHSFQDLLGGNDAAAVEYRWLMDTSRETGFVQGHETECLRLDGERFAVELTITPMYDEHRRWLGSSLILRDITSRKQREAEIHRLNAHLNQQVEARTKELAEKVSALAHANVELQSLDRTRSEFVSLVSHQIRAPLTNMLGAVDRMGAACATVNPTCSRMFTILNRQAERLERLVGDVLNADRIENGNLSLLAEPVSLSPLIEQAVEQIGTRDSHRTIHFDEIPGLPLALADRDRVLEVLVNLLDNADKYSPATKDIFIHLRADQDKLTVAVRDQGDGLPPEAIGRVFEKFYRTDSSDSQSAYGYGLGLYVCRLLVEAQGGRIWVENHPDGGAVFCFTLPIWQG